MPHRVLVVDDEEGVRSLIRDQLERLGLIVHLAAHGEEGIELFEQVSPHLVILDFLVPRKNGFAVAEVIRRSKRGRDVPILMMSGVFKNPKTAVEAREKYRVIEFLSKPIDPERLEAVVKRALEEAGSSGREDEALELLGLEAGEGSEAPTPLPELPRGEAPSRRAPPSTTGDRHPAGGDGALPSPSWEYPAPLASALASGIGGPDDLPGRVSIPIPVPVPEGRGGPPAWAAASGLPAAGAPSGVGSDREADLLEGTREPVIVDGVYVQRPFPPLASQGDLSQVPVAQLLSALLADKATGMLDLTDNGVHRRIYVTDGRPTFMQSNAEGENVGLLLLRRGRITEHDFERCRRYMLERRRTLQQSLLELRLVSETELATAYKLLAGQLLPLSLGAWSGQYHWRDTDAFVGRVPEGNFDPLQILFQGIAKNVHPPQIFAFFAGREDVPIYRTTYWAGLELGFHKVFSSAAALVQRIDGSHTFRGITRARDLEAASALPALYALVTSGMAVLPQLDDDEALGLEVAVRAAAASSFADLGDLRLGSDDGSASVDDLRARARVEAYHDEILSKSFFEIFGLAPGADLASIKSAYFELAKRWHIDAFAGRDLGPAQERLEEIFVRLTEAYETITDPQKREEYLLFLERRAKGLPTDVGEILRGEQLFDQALAMLRRRDFIKAGEVLAEALRLNPDPLYFATMGWVLFNQAPDDDRAVMAGVEHIKRALQEQDNLPVAYQYLGAIAFRRSKYEEAKKWWGRCLEWEPNNIEASRGLRMIAQRSRERSTPRTGLLDRLRGKKS